MRREPWEGMEVQSPDPVRDGIAALLATQVLDEPAVAEPEKEVPYPTKTIPGVIPLNPAREQAWTEKWNRDHSPKHVTFQVPANVRLARLNPDHPSVQVILALEKQINGRVLSDLREP